MPATTVPATNLSPELNSDARSFELRTWILLLVLVNLGLIGNRPNVALSFYPDAVANGDWWRIFSWPLVHVSRYNLLLDAGAFLLVLTSLEEPSWWARTGQVVATVAGSLFLPLWLAPELAQTGLAGLSGPAHGLAAISALEMIAGREKDPARRRLGWLLLAGLLVKCGWELWQGQVAFSGLHFGSIGHPVVSTHAGGLLGGTLGFLLLRSGRTDGACKPAGQALS